MSRFEPGLLDRALRSLGKPAAAPQPPAQNDPVELVVGLCKTFEGFRSRPYICPANVPTIGYGATHYLDGVRVKLTDPPISEEAAERLLRAQVLRLYMPGTLRLCPGLVGAPAGAVAAIVDFTFNLGEGRLRASTLRRVVNARDWARVRPELMKWVYGGGKVLRGLYLRRVAEADLVLT